VLLDDVVARQPREVEPVAQLPLHVAPLGLALGVTQRPPWFQLQRANADRPRSPLVDARHRLEVRLLVPPLQAAARREAELLRATSWAASTRRTPGGSTATGFSKNTCFLAAIAASKCRPEVRRRGKNHAVHPAREHLLVRVKAGEHPLIRDVDAVAKRRVDLTQVRSGRRHTLGKGIAEGEDLHVAGGFQRVDRGPRPSPAAPDHADLEAISPRTRPPVRPRHRTEQGPRGEHAGGGQKVTT
jgi:hypothetical protein